MIHFAHTGQFAGTLFCGKKKTDKGMFFHPGYGILTTENIRKGMVNIQGVDQDICKDCQAIWLED